MMKKLFTINIKFKGFVDSITFNLFPFSSKRSIGKPYVLACTCKKTNPNANPKRVSTKHKIATLIISLII